MKRSELRNLTIRSLARAFRSQELSPVEVTEAFLEFIEQVDPKINSYVTVAKEEALKASREAEKEIAQGNYRGLLHGIPLAVKDIFATKGVRTTNGSKLFWNYVPNFDAAVIERLKSAGAVLLGKLYLHEFALGANIELNGVCRNPWNTEHSTGGSSSGSAAAVSAGLCVASLGTDTAGSVRMPASFCGVVGLKPTNGRVSCYGATPLSWTLDTVGPITKTVEDAAILLQTISGSDERDASSSNLEVPNYLAMEGQAVRGTKIGVPTEYFSEYCDEDVKESIQRALRLFEQKIGCQIVEKVDISWMKKYLPAVSQAIMISEAAYLHEKTLKERYSDYGPTAQRFAAGLLIPATSYIKALKAGEFFREKMMREIFGSGGFDVLITPTTETTAPLISEYIHPTFAKKRARFTAPYNVLGCPALSLPCGFDSDGLPVGMQVIGKPFDEATVLKVAQAYERETEWHLKTPN